METSDDDFDTEDELEALSEVEEDLEEEIETLQAR